jgi:hypothetical protein
MKFLHYAILLGSILISITTVSGSNQQYNPYHHMYQGWLAAQQNTNPSTNQEFPESPTQVGSTEDPTQGGSQDLSSSTQSGTEAPHTPTNIATSPTSFFDNCKFYLTYPVPLFGYQIPAFVIGGSVITISTVIRFLWPKKAKKERTPSSELQNEQWS